MKLLETKTLKIGETDYSVKLSVRAMMNYETMSGHSISDVSTLQDRIYLFYSCFKACNDMSYDQFMDLIDDKPEAIGVFINLIFDTTEKKQKAR